MDEIGNLFDGVNNLLGGLIGNDQSSSQNQNSEGTASLRGESRNRGRQSKRLNLDQEAIQAIIQETLGSADGLAAIFAGEQETGLYNSTSAAQAAGDLASKLVGELAKLTAEEVTTADEKQTTKQDQSQTQRATASAETDDEGFFESLGSALGF